MIPERNARRPEVTEVTPRRVSTGLRLEPDLHRRLEEEAARREVSVNWLITRCIERILVAYEDQVLDLPAGDR